MKPLMVVLALALAPVAARADEVHGATDIFSGHGVKMAWAIERGPDEARTMVVVRLRTAPGITEVTVAGQDPFGGTRKDVARGALKDGRLDIRIPRASFVDLPKTEWRFSRGGDKPTTIFYLGIPDTTPEFNEAARLDKYLDDRLAKP